VPLTLPPELVAELDARAEEAYLSRVKLIELLIREALARSVGSGAPRTGLRRSTAQHDHRHHALPLQAA